MKAVVLCDCHGTEKMAEMSDDRLVITDRRHGEKHVAVIPLDISLRFMDNQDKLKKPKQN